MLGNQPGTPNPNFGTPSQPRAPSFAYSVGGPIADSRAFSAGGIAGIGTDYSLTAIFARAQFVSSTSPSLDGRVAMTIT